jgi:ribosome-binding ATPase
VLNAMREVDALCQVVRGFADPAGDAPDPIGEIVGLELETILADLEIVERRIARLEKDHSSPRELELLRRLAEGLGQEIPIRRMELDEAEERMLSGYRFLGQKPLLLVLNLPEEQAAQPPPPEIARAAEERGLGLISLSAQVEMDIAQMPEEDQAEFLSALGLEEPARIRFIQAAFALCDLISMLTYGDDECRAWPVRRDTPAPRAAGKIHSDIERGFIRAEVISYQDLIELGSDTRAREAGKARVEGKDYLVKDGDCVHFRFNV